MIEYIYTAFLAVTKQQLGVTVMSLLKNLLNQEVPTDGGQIKETDSMGREIFWQDIGRPNDWRKTALTKLRRQPSNG